MGIGVGNALAASRGEVGANTHFVLNRLSSVVNDIDKTLSTVRRNNKSTVTIVGEDGVTIVGSIDSGHITIGLSFTPTTGSGTTDAISKWVTTTSLGPSNITDDGTTVAVTTPDTATTTGVVVTMNGGANGGDFLVTSGSGVGVGGAGVIGLFGGNADNADGAPISFGTGSGGGGFNGGAFTVTTGGGTVGGDLVVNLGAGGSTGGSFKFKAGDTGASTTGKYQFYNPSGGLFAGELKFTSLTADRVYTFPNVSGTVGLTTTLGANPSASVGLIAVNGTATTFLTSDSAPALSQSITPTMTGAWIFSAGVTNYSTTAATQLALGYNSSNGMTWATSSTGATVVTLAGSNSGSNRVVLTPSGTAMVAGAATLSVTDFSSNQRFYVGRTSGANALNHGVRMGFSATNYLQISNGIAAGTDHTVSLVASSGTPHLAFNSTVPVDFAAAVTTSAGLTLNTVALTQNTVASVFNNGITVNTGFAVLNAGYTLGLSTSSGIVGTATSSTASDYRVTPLAPFSGVNATLAPAWTTGHTYAIDDIVTSDGTRQYQAISAGVAGATAPTGTGYAISDGTVNWDFVGLIHTGASKYSQFAYQAGTPYPEFIGLRGYNMIDATGGRMDTTEYSWYEQMTWGWNGTGGGHLNRSAEWMMTHVTPAGNEWHPWDTNLDGAGSEDPVFSIQCNASRTICAFSFNNNGFILGTAAQPLAQLDVRGAGTVYLGSPSTIQWEGATSGGSNYMLLGVVDPTGTRTINFPDKSGTVVVAPSLTAFTQTYATASHTHSNPTASAVATTAAALVSYGYTQAQADSIPVAINALIADIANIKQVLNAAIDDGQLSGAFA